MLLKGLQKLRFSTTGNYLNLPIVDISNFLQLRSSYEKECKVLVDCLKNHGAALIKDPRIHRGQFNEFFDLMEKYFYTRATQFKQGQKLDDVFPQYLYQSGLAPQGSEKSIAFNKSTANESCSIFTKKLMELNPSAQQIVNEDEQQQIQMLRLRWRIGEKPKGYRLLDPPRFHPKDFPTFAYTLDRTANYFQQSLFAVAQMCAVGLDLPHNTFTKRLYGGPDILGPTGIDMSVVNDNELIQSMRYHYAFLQIQGNPRYPGLNIFDNNGKKHEANYPSNVCLIQAGLEFEILTGGYIPASHYEVVRKNEIAEKLKDKNVTEPWKNWRVSSTQFSHMKHDIMLKPLDKFKSINPEYEKMQPIQAYELFSQEVKKRFAVSFGDEMKQD